MLAGLIEIMKIKELWKMYQNFKVTAGKDTHSSTSEKQISSFHEIFYIIMDKQSTETSIGRSFNGIFYDNNFFLQ